MTDSPDFLDGADESVGAAIARWRKKKRIAGQELGDRVGMSQAKISRLETGVSHPDPQDIRRIAVALELPADEVERLVSLADRSSNQLVEWQFDSSKLARRQHYVGKLETSAYETRVFQPAVVPGLLQTSEYARAVLTAFRTQLADNEIANSALEVSEAVAARIQRSQALDDPRRQFRFLITEDAIRRRVCPPADMLAQISRLRQVAGNTNVDVRIIPEDAEWPIAPFHGFVVLDDRSVIVDLFNTGVWSRGRRIVGHYRHVFDALDSIATSEIEPILDACQKRYIRMIPGTAA
jgi:transcriptional regulator with XRE-family HTH domain